MHSVSAWQASHCVFSRVCVSRVSRAAVRPGVLLALLLTLPFLSTRLYAQKHNIRFEQLSVEQGLSQSSVSCILQDSKGFMWFGTQDGLNKYDGYSWVLFKNDPEDPNSLSANWIQSIYEDPSGVLWVGTVQGELLRLDPRRVVDPPLGALGLVGGRTSEEGERLELLRTSEPLASDTRSLRFDYALPTTLPAKDTLYRTRLVGLEDRWRDWTGEAFREFSTLPPGDYELLVEAKDGLGRAAAAEPSGTRSLDAERSSTF